MESITSKAKSRSSGMLAPGFRFHPTDEELVWYYLRRKVCGKGFRFDAISEIDIYKIEPWDLHRFSKLKSRDLEWYFFSMLDKKYGNGARTNRATEKGYWKTTGKDRTVHHRTQIVGMKKTLVYHIGRAPKGQRTNWVMHEYKLTDLELERAGVGQDAFVLCRVFQKSGSGPKNGEQYGAPFVEEEWEDDEFDAIPGFEIPEEVDLGDDVYLDGDDLEQILGSEVPSNTSVPVNIQSTDGSGVEEIVDSISDTQNLLVNADERHSEIEQHKDKNFYDLPVPCDEDVRAVKHEYIGESSKSGGSDNLDFLLDEPYFDSSDILQFSSGGFIETNDLSNPNENNSSAFDMLDEYLTFFDANNDPQDLTYDPSLMIGSDDVTFDESLLPWKELNDENEHPPLPDGQFADNNNKDIVNNDNDAASPSVKLDSSKYEPDFQYPFIKKASHMLGSIPAPSAFAAEFPTKEASLRLNSLYQPSSSAHVTAGMIQIRNSSTDIIQRDQLLGKLENFKIVLSFGFAQGEDGSATLESGVSILPGKTVSSISRGLLCFIFYWVLMISMSFQIGKFVCAEVK